MEFSEIGPQPRVLRGGTAVAGRWGGYGKEGARVGDGSSEDACGRGLHLGSIGQVRVGGCLERGPQWDMDHVGLAHAWGGRIVAEGEGASSTGSKRGGMGEGARMRCGEVPAPSCQDQAQGPGG